MRTQLLRTDRDQSRITGDSYLIPVTEELPFLTGQSCNHIPEKV